MWLDTVVTYFLASFVIYSSCFVFHHFGKKGLQQGASPLRDELEFDTSESPDGILNRGLITTGVLIGLVIIAWFWLVPGNPYVDEHVALVVSAGLVSLIPYISGTVEAYGAAKDRKNRGITRLQELSGQALYFKACCRYKLEEKDGCFGPDNTYQLTWYFDKSNLGVNKYIFHDAKDDDIMYLFDTTSKNQIRDLKRSQSVVIYRKATDTVVGSGSLTVSGLLK